VRGIFATWWRDGAFICVSAGTRPLQSLVRGSAEGPSLEYFGELLPKKAKRGVPPNFTLKLVRPGFGPPAEPARRRCDGVTAVALATRCCTRHARQPPRRSGFGTRTLAAQLSVRSVGQTKISGGGMSLFYKGDPSRRSKRPPPHGIMDMCPRVAQRCNRRRVQSPGTSPVIGLARTRPPAG
jgi:hypothetical protein